MKDVTNETVRGYAAVNVKNLTAFFPSQIERKVIALNIILDLEQAFSATLTLEQKDEAEKALINAKDAQDARQAMQRVTQNLLKNSKDVEK